MLFFINNIVLNGPEYPKWKNNHVSVISIHTYFNFFHLFSCVYDESQFGQAIEEGGDRYMPPTKSVQHISNQSSIFLCISILHYFHTGQNIDITKKNTEKHLSRKIQHTQKKLN